LALFLRKKESQLAKSQQANQQKIHIIEGVSQN